MSILKLLEISINNLINVKEDFVEEAQVSTDQGVEHRHKMPLLPNPPLYPPHEHQHTHTISTPRVEIFSENRFTGITKELLLGDYTLSKLESMEDSYSPFDIQSVKLYPETSLELYEKDNFVGTPKIFNMSDDVSEFPDLNIVVRSIKVKGLLSEIEDKSLGEIEEHEKMLLKKDEVNEVLYKYKEYIDIENLKNDVHTKNNVVLSDLHKKTKQQEKNIKKLKEENAKIIKVSKEMEVTNKENENKSNKYKQMCIVIGILLIILIFLLVFKYKNYQPINNSL